MWRRRCSTGSLQSGDSCGTVRAGQPSNGRFGESQEGKTEHMRRAFHLAVMLGHVAIFSGCVQLSGDAGPQEGARRSGGIEYPGQAPGRAAAKVEQNRLILENNVIRCVWSIDGGKLRPVSVTDKVAATSLEMGDAEAFHLRLDDGLHGDGPQSDGSQGEARPPAEVRYLSARDFAAAGEPRVWPSDSPAKRSGFPLWPPARTSRSHGAPSCATGRTPSARSSLSNPKSGGRRSPRSLLSTCRIPTPRPWGPFPDLPWSGGISFSPTNIRAP